MSDVTRILNAIERGDGDPKREESRLGTHAKATDELLPLVYFYCNRFILSRRDTGVAGTGLYERASGKFSLVRYARARC
jgi:hypothetical protein